MLFPISNHDIFWCLILIFVCLCVWIMDGSDLFLDLKGNNICSVSKNEYTM